MNARDGRLLCGSTDLPEYAAGRLPLERAHAWDRHLVACEVCRSAVAAERVLQARLLSAPALPPSLRDQLLALSLDTVPAVVGPRPPVAPRGLPALPVLAPEAPPAHVSALRAVASAAAVAGLTAAAAWTLGLLPVGSTVAPAPATFSPRAQVPAGQPAGSHVVPAEWRSPSRAVVPAAHTAELTP